MVYTDGACFFGDRWDCALAGAAVVRVHSDGLDAAEVDRFLLPSPDHSAFRAESFAVLRALELYHKVDIYTDCQAVVTLLQHTLDAKTEGRAFFPGDHTDIWKIIAQHIQARECEAVRVFKTKAHVEWKQLPPGPQRFMAYCNDLADRAAKKAVVCDHFDLWQRMQSIVNTRETIEKNMNRIHTMLAEIHLGYYEGIERTTNHVVEIPENLQVAPVPPLRSLHVLNDDQIAQSKFGTKFLTIFRDWISGLQWGGATHCSCLELYFSFAIATKCLVPVLVPKQGYQLRQDSMLADVSSLELRTQSVVWIKVIRWWLKAIHAPVSVERGLGLAAYGYSSIAYQLLAYLSALSLKMQKWWPRHCGHISM